MKKIIIGKSIIAMLIAPVLFSGTAHASPNDGLVGSLDFSGKIVDSAPHWTWNMPDAAKAEVSNWVFNSGDGYIKDDKMYFGKQSLYVKFLNGHTVREYAQGSPSLIPTITIAGNSDSPDDSDHPHSVPVTSNGKTVGTMTFTSNTGASASLPLDDKTYVSYQDGKMMSKLAAATIKDLGMQTAQKYGMTFKEVVEPDWRKIFSKVTSPDTTHLLLAAQSELAHFTISFPKDQVPSEWTAHVPVTVTIK